MAIHAPVARRPALALTRGAVTTTRVFRVGMLVALVHALDDAFVERGRGLGLGQHALAGLIALAAGLAAVAVFPRLRPGLRAALAFWFGALALTNGAMHVGHAGAVTGVPAALAGVVLIGLAAAIPWRERGHGTWKSRAVGLPVGVIAGVLVLLPMGMGIVETHKWREPVGAAPSAAYENVRFQAADGLDLAGWYRPSRNGAAVLLVHGGGSDRKGSVAHAQMLARHGYGVLLYDARGRGESDGSPNGYGWDWPKDVAGALKFLQHRSDVDPTRIGALGLSTGADVLIDLAAERRDIAAVVADGAAAGSYEDWHRLRGNDLGAVPGAVMFTTIRVLSGDSPGRPLEDAVRRLTSPALLISAGTAEEYEFNVLYAQAGGDRVEHWNLPDAQHTHAIHSHRAEYERRVVAFLDKELAR